MRSISAVIVTTRRGNVTPNNTVPVANSTPDHKDTEINKLDKNAHIASYLTESKRDIAGVQAGTNAPCVLLQYPLGEAGNHAIDANTPKLEVTAKPR